MEVVRVGRSGLRVSRLCLGTEYFGAATPREDAIRLMHAAKDAGITFWDTSNAYNKGVSEEIVGECLADRQLRSEIVLQTKVFYPRGPGANDEGGGRRHILLELDQQLARLNTDWIDLYYLHRCDFDTPLEETVETLDACVRSGKIRYWGASTFPAWKLAEAWWRADRRGWAPPICEQAPYNILDRRVENERIPLYREYGIGLTTWSALAGGLLTGKYSIDAMVSPPAGSRLEQRLSRWKNRVNADGLEKAAAIAALAKNAGIDPVHFAIAWLLHQDVVTSPVIGPRDLRQLESYLGSVDVSLADDLLAEVDRIVHPGTAVADFHDTSGWYVGSVPGLSG